MKRAFTLLELVFVIVVIGILAALILPRTKTNPVQEAAIDLVSKIRYTQHLAMVDDKYNINGTWYKTRWQIQFNGNTYSITSKDKNNNIVYAINPSNKSTTLSNIDLNKKYSVILAVSGTECGVSNGISFDYLGRPMAGDLNSSAGPYSGISLVQNDCNITITDGTETAIISIQPETGYAHIEDIP